MAMSFIAQPDFILTLRVASALAMLVYGSYSDLRFREITDTLWIVFAVVGLGLNGLQFILLGLESLDPVLSLVSFGVTAGIALALYWLGFYGGADAKALIVVAIIIPIYSSVYTLHPFAPLTVLTNGFMVTLVLPVGYLVFNLVRLARGERIFKGFEAESSWRKFLAALLGYRTRRKGEGKFLVSLEKVVDGKRRFELGMMKDEVEFTEKADIWVTPGIPLVAFLTIGFLIALYPGDILGLVFAQFFPVPGG